MMHSFVSTSTTQLHAEHAGSGLRLGVLIQSASSVPNDQRVQTPTTGTTRTTHSTVDLLKSMAKYVGASFSLLLVILSIAIIVWSCTVPTFVGAACGAAMIVLSGIMVVRDWETTWSPLLKGKNK